METGVEPRREPELRVSYGRCEGRGALAGQGPADHITGELTAREVRQAVYTVRFWARDTRNHLYRAVEFDDPRHDVHEAQCTRGRVIPARWAFRDELSQPLDDNRDHTRDCRTCFRQQTRRTP